MPNRTECNEAQQIETLNVGLRYALPSFTVLSLTTGLSQVIVQVLSANFIIRS
jgi:hypothetical protein